MKIFEALAPTAVGTAQWVHPAINNLHSNDDRKLYNKLPVHVHVAIMAYVWSFEQKFHDSWLRYIKKAKIDWQNLASNVTASGQDLVIWPFQFLKTQFNINTQQY